MATVTTVATEHRMAIKTCWNIPYSLQIHIVHTGQKMKFSIKDFFSKCDQTRSFPVNLVKFTEEILNWKLNFFCSISVGATRYKKKKPNFNKIKLYIDFISHNVAKLIIFGIFIRACCHHSLVIKGISKEGSKFKLVTGKSNNSSENEYLIRDKVISIIPNLFLLWLRLLLNLIKWKFCLVVIRSIHRFPCLLRSCDTLSVFLLNLWISRLLWCLFWKLLVVIWGSVVHA